MLDSIVLGTYTIPAAIVSGAYLILIVLGYLYVSDYKRPRTSFLKRVMTLYNVTMVVFHAMQAWHLSAVLTDGDSQIDGLSMDNTEVGKLWTKIHALSRPHHIVDTLFMLIRHDRGRLTYAHVFHNSTVMILWALVLDNETMLNMGTIRVTALVNSVMYLAIYAYWSLAVWGQCITPGGQLTTGFVLSAYCALVVHSGAMIYVSQSRAVANMLISGFWMAHQIIMLLLVFPLLYKKRNNRCWRSQRETDHDPTVGEEVSMA
jgi:hypothetical protein